MNAKARKKDKVDIKALARNYHKGEKSRSVGPVAGVVKGSELEFAQETDRIKAEIQISEPFSSPWNQLLRSAEKKDKEGRSVPLVGVAGPELEVGHQATSAAPTHQSSPKPVCVLTPDIDIRTVRVNTKPLTPSVNTRSGPLTPSGVNRPKVRTGDRHSPGYMRRYMKHWRAQNKIHATGPTGTKPVPVRSARSVPDPDLIRAEDNR